MFYLQVSDCSRKVTPSALHASAVELDIPPLYALSNTWRPLPFMDAAVADLASADPELTKVGAVERGI